MFFKDLHYAKGVRIRSFSSPYFPEFKLNPEKYSASLRIQSKCGKIWTRKTPNTDTFQAVLNLPLVIDELKKLFQTLCVIWFHSHNLKSVKNTYVRVIIFSKVASSTSSCTKSITPAWAFFTFSKFYKWYQIAQSITFK